MAHIIDNPNTESIANKAVMARDMRRAASRKLVASFTPGVRKRMREDLWKVVVTSPAIMNASRAAAGEGLIYEVFATTTVSRAALIEHLRLLATLDVASDLRKHAGTNDEQIADLEKMAASVNDRGAAEAYRQQARALREANPTAAYLSELQKTAARHREQARAAGTHDAVRGQRDAADALDQVIATLRSSPSFVPEEADTAATVYATARAQVIGLRDRIVEIAKGGGLDHSIPLTKLEGAESTITKAAPGTRQLPVGRWVALAETRRMLDAELNKVLSMPVSNGPTRINVGASSAAWAAQTNQDDPLLAKAAAYSQIADTVTDRSQAAAYRAMAAEAEAEYRRNKRRT